MSLLFFFPPPTLFPPPLSSTWSANVSQDKLGPQFNPYIWPLVGFFTTLTASFALFPPHPVCLVLSIYVAARIFASIDPSQTTPSNLETWQKRVHYFLSLILFIHLGYSVYTMPRIIDLPVAILMFTHLLATNLLDPLYDQSLKQAHKDMLESLNATQATLDQIQSSLHALGADIQANIPVAHQRPVYVGEIRAQLERHNFLELQQTLSRCAMPVFKQPSITDSKVIMVSQKLGVPSLLDIKQFFLMRFRHVCLAVVCILPSLLPKFLLASPCPFLAIPLVLDLLSTLSVWFCKIKNTTAQESLIVTEINTTNELYNHTQNRISEILRLTEGLNQVQSTSHFHNASELIQLLQKK